MKSTVCVKIDSSTHGMNPVVSLKSGVTYKGFIDALLDQSLKPGLKSHAVFTKVIQVCFDLLKLLNVRFWTWPSLYSFHK